MKKLFIIILVAFLATACEIKHGTGQWNLNETVVWESENPDDYSVLFIKLSNENADSSELSNKNKLDEGVLRALKKNGLGDQAENDTSTETDMHFVVAKDYKNALSVILSVVDTFNIPKKVIVYRRDYTSLERWVDTVIYSE